MGNRGVRGKYGQTTLFIIIGLVIVAIALLVYFLVPGIRTGLVSSEENPPKFIQTCLEDSVEKVVEELSTHGGSIVPEHYIVYDGDRIEYLCYTEEDYLPCVVERPLLKKHIEEEITNSIKDEAKTCFDELEKSYRDKGYAVDLRRGAMDVELLPKRIVINFGSSMKIAKGDDQKSYDTFKILLNNNLYELVAIANSIIEWETIYGDAETTTYMNYYHDLKVEKKKQIEGSTIYILTDRNNGKRFQFASRSMPFPPGYGLT